MKKLVKKLPLVAFVLALFVAFAFSSPAEVVAGLYTPVSVTENATGWKNITGMTLDGSAPYASNSYRCDANPSQICTGEFSSAPSNPSDIPDLAQSNGSFIENP